MSPKRQRCLLPAEPVSATTPLASRKRTLAPALQPRSSTRPRPLDTVAEGEALVETDSGSSDSPEPTAQRGLCRRVQRLDYHHGRHREELLSSITSFLEAESVGGQTQKTY
jgi:hypothetical protein